MKVYCTFCHGLHIAFSDDWIENRSPSDPRPDRVIGNGRVARNECLESVLESWKDVFYPTVPFPSCILVFLFFPVAAFFFSNNLNLEAKHS